MALVQLPWCVPLDCADAHPCRIVGRKAPFKLRDIRARQVRVQLENRIHELALSNLGSTSNADRPARAASREP